MRRFISLVLLLVCVAPVTPSAFGERPKTTRVVAKFGGECEVAPFRHSARLERLIKKAKRDALLPCDTAFCDGAFAYDLNGDGKDEYFVRLWCSATGNCTWGIFSDNPARLRGVFSAWFFYIHRRTGSWSTLSTYTRLGGDRGVIAAFANRRGMYIQTSRRIEEGDYRDPQPFLTRMGVPNCS
ncbi:MAG: hypothetical protein H7Z38_08445 [Rubrivivax sp.]|nr:hypothetical protein [Pyrinomonadaceae bacterium]